MNPPIVGTDQVSGQIMSEILGIMGLQNRAWARRVLYPLFRSPVRKISQLLVDFDCDIANIGWQKAASNLLGRFIDRARVILPDPLPKDGPLLIVANHPGAYDVILLVSQIEREDLKLITSTIPLVRSLPHVSPHFIFIEQDALGGMAAFRAALRHLHQGGSVLIFPRGQVEADPSISPEQMEAGLTRWSHSIEMLLEKAPLTSSVVATVSGVLSSDWFHHPIPRLWKKPEQRQKVAEIFQVVQHMLRDEKPNLTPLAIFSRPVQFPQLFAGEWQPGKALEAIVQIEKQQLARTLAFLQGEPGGELVEFS